MKITQQDLESLNLSMNEATDVAQNCPLWRMMSTFGTNHSCTAVHARNEWMNGGYIDTATIFSWKLRIRHQPITTPMHVSRAWATVSPFHIKTYYLLHQFTGNQTSALQQASWKEHASQYKWHSHSHCWMFANRIFTKSRTTDRYIHHCSCSLNSVSMSHYDALLLIML